MRGGALACSKSDLEMTMVSKRGSFLIQKDRHSEKNLNAVFLKFIGVDCWDLKILLKGSPLRVSKN